jgi:hypothetical protein
MSLSFCFRVSPYSALAHRTATCFLLTLPRMPRALRSSFSPVAAGLPLRLGELGVLLLIFRTELDLQRLSPVRGVQVHDALSALCRPDPVEAGAAVQWQNSSVFWVVAGLRAVGLFDDDDVGVQLYNQLEQLRRCVVPPPRGNSRGTNHNPGWTSRWETHRTS